MKFCRRHGTVDLGVVQKRADERIGVEQHLRRKQDVVDPDDALFVEHAIIEKRRAAVQREVQRVMQIVIEVRAGADDEIDQTAFHDFDDAAAKTGRRQCAGDGEADRRVVIFREHLVAVDAARFTETRGVERLKAVIDELLDFLTAARAVVIDGLTGKK
jgi:hypothetical protein